MYEKTLGRKPGDLCPDCNKGRLAAVFQEHNVGAMPVGGPAVSLPSLHHLHCTACKKSYPTDMKGSLESLLRSKLGDFKQPRRRPQHCGQCKEEPTEYAIRDGLAALATMRSVRARPHQYILCCRGCMKILWKFRRPPKPLETQGGKPKGRERGATAPKTGSYPPVKTVRIPMAPPRVRVR